MQTTSANATQPTFVESDLGAALKGDNFIQAGGGSEEGAEDTGALREGLAMSWRTEARGQVCTSPYFYWENVSNSLRTH